MLSANDSRCSGTRYEADMSHAKAIPDGYHSVQPYLMFRACTDAIRFYAEVFGAREVMCMRDDTGRVQHAEIEIGDSRVMMADENPAIGALSAQQYGGTPIGLMLYIEDCDSIYHRALAAGAKSLREPADQPYGDRMAGIEDPFGYKWYVATHIGSAKDGTSA